MKQTILTVTSVESCALALGQAIQDAGCMDFGKCYAVPRGGVPAAFVIDANFTIELVDTPEEADFFMDDIIDSGATKAEYERLYPGKPFFALIDKTSEEVFYSEGHPDHGTPHKDLGWVVFPWEGSAEDGIAPNVVRMLQYIGEDPTRGGLQETPNRVAKAWAHWTQGYNVNIEALFKTFEDGAENADQMVVVKNIPFYSHCEHHMAPFFGTVTMAYIPKGKVIGLSKLSRIVSAFAQRLQVQERMTNEIANAIAQHLQPEGVGVYVQARHMCMESRGVCQQGSSTITTALRGAIKESPDAKAEFLGYANK